MPNIVLHFIARLSNQVAGGPDCLLFATEDGARGLPVWVPGPADLGGRPSDGNVLAEVLATEAPGEWTATFSWINRGQCGVELSKHDRTIDIRASLLEPLWHAGVLKVLQLDPLMAHELLDFNPEWIQALRVKAAKQSEGNSADISDAVDPIYIEWDEAEACIDGIAPQIQVDEISDEDFDEEMKKLLGE